MKVIKTQFIIAISLSILISYGFYSFCYEKQKITLSIGSFILNSIVLTFAFGIEYSNNKKKINLSAISFLFFLISLAFNIVFSLTNFSNEVYFLVTGIIVLIYILLFNTVLKVNH